MEYFDFNGVELPERKSLFKAMISIRKADEDHIEELTEILHDSVLRFADALKVYDDLEYTSDPDNCSQMLLKLHDELSAILGLCDGLFRKVKSREYIQKLEKDEKKLAAAHLEYYARDIGAHIEALSRSLDLYSGNLMQRIAAMNGRIKRF